MSAARLLILISAFLTASGAAQLLLNVTAIGAQNGFSTIECWEVNSPLYTSTNRATAGARVAHLGNVSNLSWTVALPGQYVGPHNAPFNQWVILLEGLTHVALPHDNSTSAYIAGGEFGLLFAADTAEVSCDGHASRYLGSSESVYLQIPTWDGQVPEHKRLHMGPCIAEELAGWRLDSPTASRYDRRSGMLKKLNSVEPKHRERLRG